jgi:xanthine dehydrogenase YagT iron-sulfur-binding subunit
VLRTTKIDNLHPKPIHAQQWTFTGGARGSTLLLNRLAMKRTPSSAGSAANIAALASPVSRRQFLRGLGTTAVSTAALGAQSVGAELARANAEKLQGPAGVPVTLSINGARHSFALEPRVTLLEALRIHAGVTGPKEVCERATCGACTVLLDGVPVYACMILAIEAQGREITTVEGISKAGRLTPLQQAIVAHDGLQCGYCTPGFVMTLTALLKRNPNPTEADIRQACAGHLCRCGSYPRIFSAALAASRNTGTAHLNGTPPSSHAVA